MIPQAFTTRDMSEAYKWLQTLPPSVRDEIKSMEQAAMLYIKAKRLGGGAPSREDVEGVKNQSPVPVALTSEESKPPQEIQKTLKNLKFELDRFDLNSQPTTPATPSTPAPAPQEVKIEIPSSGPALDSRSKQIIREIREGLNLGSDIEVLRMSLVLAHKTLRDLLK